MQAAFWNPGNEVNVSPVGCALKAEVNRVSQPKRAVRPLQGSNAKIEVAVRRLMTKNRRTFVRQFYLESGGDLLSRTVTSQVPSALKGLTSVFGMGTGVTPSLSPPEMVSYFRQVRSVVLFFLFAFLLAPLCRRAHAYMG